MPKILELPKLVNQHCVAEVQIRCGWIETCLNPERAPFLQFFNQFIFRQNFIYPPTYLRSLIFQIDHGLILPFRQPKKAAIIMMLAVRSP